MDSHPQPDNLEPIQPRKRSQRRKRKKAAFSGGTNSPNRRLDGYDKPFHKLIRHDYQMRSPHAKPMKGKIHWRVIFAILMIVGLLAGILTAGYLRHTRRVAQQALEDGLVALQSKQWEQACTHLKIYLLKNPNDLEILVRYAEANLAIQPRTSKHHGAAVGAYLRYLQIKPGDPEITDRLARLCYALKDYKRLEQVSRWRLALAPDDPRATIWLARALIGQQQRTEGMQVLIDLVKRRPGEVELYNLLSDLTLQEGTETATADAQAWLDRGVSHNPESGLLRAQRALFNQRVKKDGKAARIDLGIVAAQGSNDLRTMLVMTEAWLALGELDRAYAQLQLIDQLDPDILADNHLDFQNLRLALFSAKADLYLRRGDIEEGIRLADEALHTLSGHRRTTFLPLAVNLYLAGGDIDSARKNVDEYQTAIQRLNQTDVSLQTQLRLLRASIANAEGKSYLVIDLLEPLLEGKAVGGVRLQGVEHVDVWKLLAQAYHRIRQDRRALAALEKYVVRSPGDGEATLALAKGYYRMHDFAKARQYAEAAERLRPDDLETRIFRVRASFKYALESTTMPAGGPPSGEILALCQAYPHHVEVRLLMAMALTGQGRHDEAVAELKRACEECADPLPAAIQLVMLYKDKGQYEQAIQVGTEALRRVQDQAAPWILLAELYSLANQPQEARRTLDQAIILLHGEENLIAQLALVRHLLAQNERRAGMELLEQLTRQYPEDERPRLQLLQLPEVQKDTHTAQRLVDQLRNIEGERGLRWSFAQAQLWLRADDWRKRLPEITRLMQRCIEADPGWASPVAALGKMYEALEQDERAEEIYRRFFSNHPAEAEVAINYLGLLDRQQRYIEAGRILNRIPAGLSIMSAFRIRIAVGRGDYATAIGELRQRIGTDPQDAIARVMLAQLTYHHTRQIDPAMKLLDEAYALQPDLMTIASTRAMILQAEGRLDEAIAFLDAEVARRNDFSAYFLRAEFFAEIRQFDKAEKDYLHLTQFADSVPEGFDHLGRFYERTGQIDKAMQAWESGLKIDPNHMVLQRSLIRLLVSNGRPEDRQRGRTMLENILKQRSDDAVLLSIWASLLADEGTPEATAEAMRVLEKVVQINPRNAVAHLKLIEQARNWGDLREANIRAERALGANPENANLLSIKADLARRLEQTRAAWALARQVLKIDPHHVNAHILLVYLALRSGQLDEAEHYSTEAVRLDPENEEVQLVRALVLNAQGHREQAIALLEAYIRQGDGDPCSARLMVILSDLYRFAGDLPAAITKIEQAASWYPDDPFVFLASLRCLAAENNYDEVLKRYAERRKNKSDEPEVLQGVAAIMAYAKQVQYVREARLLYRQLTSLTPDYVNGYLGLGQVSYQLGELEDADQAYRQVLRLDPYHQQALNNLAWILGADGKRIDEAMELATKGVLRYPDDPHLLDTRGLLLFKRGKYEEARKDLEKAMSLLGATAPPAERAHTLFTLGRTYLKLEQTSVAATHLHEALNIDREHKVLNAGDRDELLRLLDAIR